MISKTHAILLAGSIIFAVAVLSVTIQAVAQDQIKEEPLPILNYFGNLTATERNSKGQISRIIFEDGAAFQVNHYIRIPASGINRYYNVTYQAPDLLISIQEYVKGLGFR